MMKNFHSLTRKYQGLLVTLEYNGDRILPGLRYSVSIGNDGVTTDYSLTYASMVEAKAKFDEICDALEDEGEADELDGQADFLKDEMEGEE